MRQQSQKQKAENSQYLQAFSKLYTHESDAIFRFCYMRVSDRDVALDLTADIFTSYWQKITDGENIDHPRAFLYKIARNRIIDWYRKKKSISLESLADTETEEPYEPINDNAKEDMGLESEGRFLLDKIKDISDGNRDAVYLRFVEGLSPPEIANVLGISANATSVRINRGIEELRKMTGYQI